MKSYNFTLVVDGLDPDSPGFEDRLFDAGCTDGLIAVQKGLVTIEFDRTSKNFIQAVRSAIINVASAGGKTVRVEPDPLVTISDVAARTGLTKQSISNYARGERGSGDFPSPAYRVVTDSPLWNWTDVSRWLVKRGHWAEPTAVVHAAVIEHANSHFLSRFQKTSTRMRSREIKELVIRLSTDADRAELQSVMLQSGGYLTPSPEIRTTSQNTTRNNRHWTIPVLNTERVYEQC